MRFKKQVIFLIILSIVLVTVLVLDKRTEAETSPYDLVIGGLVDHPLNFTYSELQRFPMVSEAAPLECIGGVTWFYNWTGIPLFFLLRMTGVKAWATEVVFYASDRFSSSITIEKALHPTTLLALQANGAVLSRADGYPYRLVVPCKYGYKWVKWIKEIKVVDYDYKGTYESRGFSDDANIPSCTLPSTTPPYEAFHILLGTRTYSIITLCNSTINSFNFTLGEKICFKIAGSINTTSYCYFAIPKELLKCYSPLEWQVWVNNKLKEDRNVIEIANYTYSYFTFNQESQEATIILTVSNASERTHHDIGVIYATTSKTILGQGYNLNITVITLNYDNNTETRTLTVYANMTLIASQNVALARKNATTVTFTWDSSGFAKGNYTISVYATPIPDEIDPADNTYTDGNVIVAMIGDITGPTPNVPDGKIDIRDLAAIAKLYGIVYPDPKYNPNCDLTGPITSLADGKIDIRDLALAAKNYGQIDP